MPPRLVKKNIAIFLHHPICSTESVNGIVKALSPAYDLRIFTKHAVHEGFFDDVDLVIFPGGYGDAGKFEHALKANTPEVKRFLRRGGKYLGICMGAYWADAYYFDILKDTRVQQYIKRPRADIRSSYGTTLPVDWQGQPQRMYFYDGPTFVGGTFETIASYANGDPMAIVQGHIGLIGCHLESEQFWYQRKYMQPHWHQGEHHRKLLQYVADHLLGEPQMALF
ncbi:MAG: hypothetical protein RL404_1258 [Pseudomonadota bacterium]|jgi:hypothetical protein